MKWLGKRLLRIISSALAIVLAAVLFPYAKPWLSDLLPQGKYQRISMLLTHELEEAGELTVIKYADTGIMHTETNALFLGKIQEVTVPYSYEIGFGFKLSDVHVRAEETGLSVYLPEIGILYDTFQATDNPEIKDFWNLLSQKQYQKMLDDQSAACRAEYEANAQYHEETWEAACRALEGLFRQWSGQSLSLTFLQGPPPETEATPEI